jgi:hypothetical protein
MRLGTFLTIAAVCAASLTASVAARATAVSPRSSNSCGGDQLTGPVAQLSNETVSGTIIQGCLPEITEQSNSDGSVDTCLVWTFWIALPSGDDAAILVASPASGSLQGAGIRPTDPDAVQIEESLTQALSDLENGQHVKTSVGLSGSEVDCGRSLPNDVTSATLSAPQLQATLRELLKPSGERARRGAIDHAGGYTFQFSPPFAGKLLIDWSATVHGKQTLIASASAQLSGTTYERVKIKLTNAGRVLLKVSRRLKITATAMFFPVKGITTSSTATSSTVTFVLKN